MTTNNIKINLTVNGTQVPIEPKQMFGNTVQLPVDHIVNTNEMIHNNATEHKMKDVLKLHKEVAGATIKLVDKSAKHIVFESVPKLALRILKLALAAI